MDEWITPFSDSRYEPAPVPSDALDSQHSRVMPQQIDDISGELVRYTREKPARLNVMHPEYPLLRQARAA